MKKGVIEKDVMRVIYCSSAKNLINAKHCNSDNCEHHVKTEKQVITSDDAGIIKVVGHKEYVFCALPRRLEVASIIGLGT